VKIFNHVPVEIKTNLTTKEIDGKRYYLTESGDAYPSVTTVTGWEKREFFAEWRRKNPEESKRVLKRGTKFHSIIEDYLNNKEIDQDKYAPGEYYLFSQLKQELNKIDNIYALETALQSSLLSLAGRVDCIAEFAGNLSIIDFKTCSAEKSKDSIKEYFMQATAYAIMFQEQTGIPVKNIVILMSCEDGSVTVYQENPINYTKQLKEAIESFMINNS
jgi:genome maintenance exonuclease 1